MSILGALLLLIGTLFHPPLTNPWDVSYAFKKMISHHNWILDHWIFFGGLLLWLLGLAHLANSYSTSDKLHSSGGRTAANCFVGSLIIWSMIMAMEIAVLPPLSHSAILNGENARLIWDVLFTWGLFAGYIGMAFVYIGILYLSYLSMGVQKVLAIISGMIGVIGIIITLLIPDVSLMVQLSTAPFPYLWTVWFSLKPNTRNNAPE